MQVLISGAGIAGSCVAFWLAKAGHKVTVIERFPELRTTGLQVDLRGHGIEVLKRMGIEQAFREKAAPELGLKIVDSSGRQRAFFPANRSGKGLQSFTTDYEIMRGDFCKILHNAAVSKGAKYVFGTSIKSLDGYETGPVSVILENGHADKFDLVIGADGQWSQTRRQMLGSNGHDGKDAFYPLKDVYAAYFTIPWPSTKEEDFVATMYQAPGKRGVMTRRSNANDLQIYLGCENSSESLRQVRPGNVEKEKAALSEILRGAGWEMDTFLDCLPRAQNFYCERMGLVKLESWHRGCVGLVGDAAYCPSANTGMGTSSAVVGAYILAGEIVSHCSPRDDSSARSMKDNVRCALSSYDRKFRPFMNQVQKGILEGKKGFTMPSSSLGIGMMNIVMGFMSLLKLDIGSWFMKEIVKDWQLPEFMNMSENVE